MPRCARNIVAGIIYHIVHRGNNHQTIFFAKKDYEYFLSLTECSKQKYPCKIYGYVLMPNHIHFLIETIENPENLAYYMKHIAQRYSQYINKKYSRSGTLWEGRYKSCAVDTGEYLVTCSKYIEMNPVRASIVKDPKDYLYSSYSAKIGLIQSKSLDLDPEYLSMGDSPAERQRNYKNLFSIDIMEREIEKIRNVTQKGWAYGGKDFVKKIEKITGRIFETKKVGRKLKEPPGVLNIK